MVTVIFESHAATYDNDAKLASGHYDVELSERGLRQAKELGQRRKNEHFDAIFCSDLQRSYKTAEIAFGSKYPIFKDGRLQECDYGDYEHKPRPEIEAERANRISKPYPGGESYQQRTELMKSFVDELAKNYQGKRVLIIGHRATQYGLERWINGKSLKELTDAQWNWQPGWKYIIH